jgi:hypothetical protein
MILSNLALCVPFTTIWCPSWWRICLCDLAETVERTFVRNAAKGSSVRKADSRRCHESPCRATLGQFCCRFRLSDFLAPVRDWFAQFDEKLLDAGGYS